MKEMRKKKTSADTIIMKKVTFPHADNTTFEQVKAKVGRLMHKKVNGHVMYQLLNINYASNI